MMFTFAPKGGEPCLGGAGLEDTISSGEGCLIGLLGCFTRTRFNCV